MKDHAREAYPNEACGFLVGAPAPGGDRVVSRVRPAPNTVEGSKQTRFVIHPRELIDLEDELDGTGAQILGFYHSHPDYPAAPSLFDQEHAWPWYSYVVISVLKAKPLHVTSWVLRDDRSTFDEETLLTR